MPGPLSGCTVVDLSMYVAAPLATLVLGEQGADVIKVEPLGGDPFRASGSTRHGVSSWWMGNNRHKRSIALDLKQPRGLALLHRLVADADVFVHQFRPGVTTRLGCDWEQLSALNPRLIYASVCGFGTRGPSATRRAYDNILQAYVGVGDLQGTGDPRGPQSIKTPLADKIPPLVLAQAVCAALYERESSGVGQEIEVSMLHTMLWWLWPDVLMEETFLERDEIVHCVPVRELGNLMLPTADGHLSVTFGSPAEWAAIVNTLGHPEWTTDEKLGDPVWRELNRDEVYTILGNEFRRRPTAEWTRMLDAADAAYAPVNPTAAMITDEQVIANDMVTEFEQPAAGRVVQPRSPARYSRTTEPARPAPLLGEHTESILIDLGLAADEIAELRASGVVA